MEVLPDYALTPSEGHICKLWMNVNNKSSDTLKYWNYYYFYNKLS